MAVVDLTTGKYAGNYGVEKELLDEVVTLKRYIDSTVVPNGNVGLVASDYYRLFYYPANTFLLHVRTVTETVEGVADTVDITDDETGTTVMISNHDVNTDNAITESSAGKFKATSGYVCVRPDQAITVAKFWVVLQYVKLTTTD